MTKPSIKYQVSSIKGGFHQPLITSHQSPILKSLLTTGYQLLATFLLFALYSLLLTPSAYAAPWTPNECYVQVDGVPVATIVGLQCIIQNVFEIILTLIGIAAFIMIIFAAFQILTSGPNPEKKAAGTKTLTLAAVGLGLALSAWFILQFIATFTGVDSILDFQITTTP